jgi:methyl-accepting chemotaxis protein
MMSSLSVKARLFLTTGLLTVGMFAVGLIGLSGLKQADARLDEVYGNRFVSAVSINQMINLRNENIRFYDLAIMSGDPKQFAAYNEVRERNNPQAEKLWETYKSLPSSREEDALADEFISKLQDYGATVKIITAKLEANDFTAARELRMSEMQPRLSAMFDAAEELVTLQDKLASEQMEASQAAYLHARVISWVSMLIAGSLGAFLAFLLVRSMMSSLNTAVSAAERIANGKLGNRIEINSQDEFGRLLRAMQDMDNKLSDIVGAVRQGADSVGAAAREISSGNDDLSQRTQEQASALEETASSMEEMTATVKQNADNARQASQLAVGARDQADRGGNVVDRTVRAMSEISDSSKRIADIIDVIDEIAFQTNLLALNAAVEAARAGEQGRGFAVVATEVRNLAQRSATAAKEIKDLINDSVEKVRAGTELVDESGKSLSEIVASVKRVADIVAEISAASEEQASGIDQVNTAVTQMDTSTQQNAALVEEAAASSKAMEQQAQLLVEKVSFFSTAGVAQIAMPVATRSAAAAPRRNVRPMPARKPAKAAKPAPVRRPAPMAKASGDDSTWQEF